jgi:uncharacterized membrane protein YcaP (DUF421 family)
MNALWIPGIPWWQLVIRAGVVFVAVLLLLRLSGKRQVGQMGIAQFVALLLISNAVQNSMNGGDNSLIGGLILAVVLILLSYAIEVFTYRSKRLENLIQGRPTLLIHQGKVLYKHLKRELLSPHELRAILRRQGIQDLSEIEEAVLESDGFVSVVKKSEAAEHPEPNASGIL